MHTHLRHNAGGMDPLSERRLVTCLFIDVVGSTDTTVRLGPERMQRLLREAFAEMSATITGQGGTIEKYVGDAIFALFGAPTAHADDAERALRAADACARWSSAPGSPSARLAVRVGVETGEALVDLAAVDRRERMAVGECVTVAARLQQHAEPGEIIVGPICHEATMGMAQFESLGALSLKGLGEVGAWRFSEFRAGDGAQQLAFVGRDEELGLLGDAFGRARRGTATLALIVGPPGQGKSRLASEAIGTWSAVRVIQARCRPGAETGLNTPLRQLVNADVLDASPDGIRDRLSALLGADDGVEVAAAVCHSAGLAVDSRLLAVSRLEQRELIAEAWRRYLAAVAGEAPLVAWIDDIHWADPVLLRIIDHLTSDLQAPVLVIATARPEFVGSAHLRPNENRLQIDLEPLDRDAAELLAREAGDTRSDAARAAGNPLFIIELARSRSEQDEMPVTIQAAIAARLDELSPSERDLLQRASVAGETFDLRDAALLGEREPAEVAGALGRVAHLGFVAPVGSRYRFHHALVREVAYGRLPVAERMALHGRYAVDGVDPVDVEALAHHWWEAVKPPDAQWVWQEPARLAPLRRKAFGAQLAAGRRLEERNAYEDALDVYMQAVELADGTADLALAEAAVGRAYARQGRGDEAWEHRLRAIDTYAHDLALAEAAVGRAYARQGRGDEAWEHRLRAIDTFTQARSEAPGELYADMLEIATLNWGYFQHLPDDAEVLRLLDEGERIARASGDDVSLVRLLMERAAFTNDVAGADEINRFVESPDAVRFADAAHRMAQVYLWNGKVARAMALSETVFERLVPTGAAINEPEALVWYSLAAFNAGDLARADALADRLLEEATRRSAHTRQHAYGLNALLLLARGAWDRVTATTRELRQLVDANPDTGFCLVGAAAAGYGAIAEVLGGRPLPEGLDAFLARLIPEETLIQASSLMVPKIMAGDRAALPDGLRAYAPDLRLWDRQRAWDVCDLMPAIALTMLERWDELGPSLGRLDEFAGDGGRLAGAAAAAIREEEAAARGGPQPTHDQLHALGYDGISELLHFRPTVGASPA
jgi:class 3 adenylate cyclase/tetratricopeptide (TPR) repeat protein